MEYNKRQDQKGTGGIGVEDQFNTMKHNPIVGTGNDARDILMFVYQALQVKGYDPVLDDKDIGTRILTEAEREAALLRKLRPDGKCRAEEEIHPHR